MSDDFKDRGGSPWGSAPGGGNGSGKGPTPPDIDAIIRDIQNKINKFLTFISGQSIPICAVFTKSANL